ncbi:alpha/beta fold hydrolase [Streptomyces sp. JJ66]|uniref:alpha/beta hydrolase family protein n=1 Tax=Streptomyces sp. JJ66 TaxID=2803843 RepID=UPI001C57625B|nr:alpha/beta fold hydrolase [Streptomyces sp. JJ66]MBW1603656.1 alpha/beta fold hydrolase [Streptomyces sp. JJ66]
MRPGTVAAVAASTTVLGAGAAVAVGRYAAGAALKPAGQAPPGFDGPALTVHGTGPGQVSLTRALVSRLPGIYGLTGNGLHAVVGNVLESGTRARQDAGGSPDTVVRRLVRVTEGDLRPGTRVRLTPQVYTGSPHGALDLPCADVDVPGELGPLPGWFVPGARDTWIIAVHGLGTTRDHPMVVMPLLHRMQFPVLSLAYRGDLGAPPAHDGLGRFGDDEWRDVDAAMRYALRHGAERVVLFGWSTGATAALLAAARSAVRAHVAGLVLDSPVLDWRHTLRALAARRAPGPLLPLAVRAAQGRAGLRPDRLDEAADAGRLACPALILHGPGDTIASFAASAAYAEARPRLVTLREVPHARHAGCWNADPMGVDEALRRFVTPLV